MAVPRLKFDDKGEACITCANCKRKHQLARASAPARTRLEHIFDWVTASIRSQGYKDGFLCRHCEKRLGIDTSEVRRLCRKHLTPQYFEARKNFHVTVT